jgi:hypothetical protein
MEIFYGCAPPRIWNRLEVRARTQEFERALRAEVHDPLWMLGRQWQFGEFHGEDSGSPIFAKVKLSTSPLVDLAPNGGAYKPIDNMIPLEATVERREPQFDIPARAHLGLHWMKLVTRHSAAFSANGGTPALDVSAYRDLFRATFGFVANRGAIAEPAPLRAAQLASDTRVQALLSALEGRSIDGLAVYQAFASTSFTAVPTVLTLAHASHAAPLIAAAGEFKAYVHTHYGKDDAADFWQTSQFEYRFSCKTSSTEGRKLTLAADEYYSGTLDWYAFDVAGIENSTDERTSHIASRIPSPVQFPGMPKPRFWEFEDGKVDLGNIRSDSTDTVKLLLSEFALIYGNNWFMIPCNQPAGSLGVVEGIVVTDVFGRRTLVLPATRKPERGWSRWDLFTISTERYEELPPSVFLPPVALDKLESAPIESVTLVRDEATNNVWAVETRIPDGLGGSREGITVAREIREYLAAGSSVTQPAAPGKLRYTLANTVPMNWIPFIPVHRDSGQRAIQLQRASMPRFSDSGIHPVRPLTAILRPNLRDDDAQQGPYYVNEEEIPQAGIVVSTSYQRARWYGGSVHVWLGRQKTMGRGLGSSGLRFDIVLKENG